MAMTLKEFRNSSFKKAWYIKDIKTKADLDALRNEIIELTNNSDEAIYESAKMEPFDPDDIRQLIL